MTENEIILFKHEEFGEIRTLNIDGEPWFVGKDIASKLGYTDTFGALKKHVDNEDNSVEHIVIFRYGSFHKIANQKVQQSNRKHKYDIGSGTRRNSAHKPLCTLL